MIIVIVLCKLTSGQSLAALNGCVVLVVCLCEPQGDRWRLKQSEKEKKTGSGPERENLKLVR